MKNFRAFLLIWGGLLVAVASASAQNDRLQQVLALAAQGNHREAADLGKSALTGPEASGELLAATVESLSQLQAHGEQEEVIEAAVKAHPSQGDVLLTAGISYTRLPHSGSILDGIYRRGQFGGRGRQVMSTLRDRVRALQLLEAAWKAQPADRVELVLTALAETLIMNQYGSMQAWSLRHATDLGSLPDWDDQSGLDQPATGYPVDAEGGAIFFQTPASWETAANDGERWLWITQRLGELNARQAYQQQLKKAQVARQWFSVRTLAQLGLHFEEAEDESSTRGGVSQLHTLKEGETVARLATGPKRFALPKDWDFMGLYQALADQESVPLSVRIHALNQRADELRDRRQFGRAVEEWRRALALAETAAQKKSIQEQVDQIVRPLGRLEALPGSSARSQLLLLFRNARSMSFKARKVDVARLLADTEAYLRSEPQQQDWQKLNVAAIGQRLLEAGGDQYLGKVLASWSQELQPRADHWDRRVAISLPMQEPGAYWVEGRFEGGHVTRALVWREGLVLVQTPQAQAMHYFVADAVTGEPVSGVTLRFLGYQTQWGKPGLLNRERLLYRFKDLQAISDQQGQVRIRDVKMQEFQWLIRASAQDGRTAHLGFQSLGFGDPRLEREEQARLYAITDRPVYRPGQEVKWKAWARLVGYDPDLQTNRFAGGQLSVVIRDPQGEKVWEKTYRADASGAIQDGLSLGEEAALGAYSLEFVWNRALQDERHLGVHAFRVEEYKKPEFEVSVEASKTPVALGDAFEIKIKAEYYFGGPVKQGKVKYRVRRQAHTEHWFPVGRWDWLFGPGYGLQAMPYAWYPGSPTWTSCLPRHPWMHWPSQPPELVAEGEGMLQGDGTFLVKIDTALAKEIHGRDDHRYDIEAEVTDASRRTQMGQGRVLAARKPFEVHVSLDRGWYAVGERAVVSIHARTLDGRAIQASGHLVLKRIQYDREGVPTEEELYRQGIVLDAAKEGLPTTWPLEMARGGQFRVSVLLKDEAGHEVEGSQFVSVHGAGFDEGRDFRFDELELLTLKEEYAPGDEVEITVHTNRVGSTVALFLRTENGLYPEPVWLKLKGKSLTHRFKLTEADQPNVFLDAYTVSDSQVHQVTRQIIVPPKKRIASVELLPDASTYLPGQGSQVKVKVRDQEGKPFVGQVVLTAYDKALEAISGGSNQEEIRPFFWGWKRAHIPSLQDSLRNAETGLMKRGEVMMQTLGVFGSGIAEMGMDANLVLRGGGISRGGPMMKSGARSEGMTLAMAAPAAMNMQADMIVAAPNSPPGASPSSPVPVLRTKLADSAVWVADLTTDAQGEGMVHFNLPENLTTWKLRSWVMGSETQVGEASVEVITRKNLMVRLQAPRFFVETDEVVLSANIHNDLEAAQEVKATLEFDGGVLAWLDEGKSATQSRTLPAHSEARIDWRVKVMGEGEAKVRVKALAAQDSDAMEMTFPAYTHGMLKTDAWSLALRPDQSSGQLHLTIPAARKPAQTKLEVHFTPTLAMSLVEALPYLVSYPHGCTEQTLNRFVPTVITLKVLKDLGVNLEQVRETLKNRPLHPGHAPSPVFDDREVSRMAAQGLKRLESMRHADGGWGWFPGGEESSPHITALVLHGLKAAEKAGLDLNDGFVREGVEFLKRHEFEVLRQLRLPPDDPQHRSAPDQVDALIHAVLVEFDGADAAMRELLYENRQKLSRYNLCLLGMACHALGEIERRDMCLRNVRQHLKQDDENQTAWLELPNGG